MPGTRTAAVATAESETEKKQLFCTALVIGQGPIVLVFMQFSKKTIFGWKGLQAKQNLAHLPHFPVMGCSEGVTF